MCKKIKKQIERSMPLFMIFSLVFSTMAVGLVFNLDFNFRFDKDFIELPEAQAQDDTASTTVTVMNAEPIITTPASESPTSASTTPRDLGHQIGFTITASDPETENYYLIVCDADDVDANNGAAPDCGTANQLCLSGSTADDAQASCTYSPITDPPGETRAWYAFVCDAHASEAICSTADQGTVGTDGASPFYINHPPTFTSVSTYEDNKDPGNVGDPFTVRATTTDSDSEGEDDGQHLYVCMEDSFSTTTGCGGLELCHGVATSTDYVECSFATSTAGQNWVADDGTYNYYAFVMDWHKLAANSGNSRAGTYTVNNIAPSVTNVVLNEGNNITLAMKGMTPTTTMVTATLSDQNGCSDISSATSTIYWSDATSTLYCEADDNFCYRIQSSSCELNTGTCGALPDADITVTCTTTIAYHAVATDDTGDHNPASTTNWMAGVTAIDDDGLSYASTSVSGVELYGLEALHITEDEITYGSVRGGQDSNTDNATSTIINYGNIPIDSEISGTDMDKDDFSDYIRATNQEFDLANFDYGTGTYTLSSTTPATVDIIATKPDSQTDVSDAVYWGINIPAGTTSGDYEGTNTFVATIDDDDWPSGY